MAHISNTPKELIEYSQSKGMLVEAYSPVGHGELLKNQAVKEMAGKYNVSVAQLGIRYCLQLNLLPLPKTTNLEHMKTNAAVDFEIPEEDMEFLQIWNKSRIMANTPGSRYLAEANKFEIKFSIDCCF